MTDTAYKELEKKAALRFLKTALVVDDTATIEPEIDASEDGDSGASSPDTESGSANGIETPTLGAAIDAREEEEKDSAGDGDMPQPKVNVMALANAFADKEIICGILRPDEGDPDPKITDRVVQAASQVDLVVLDWVISKKTKLTSCEAIERIVEQDQRGSRVIAVYTSQVSLDEICDNLLAVLEGAESLEDGGDPLIKIGGTVIALFRKRDMDEEKKEDQRRLDVEELAGRVVEIFLGAVRGWVRAITLNGMAAVRENVHYVLSRLDPALDVGYAANLLRIEHLDEGPTQILESIGGEFRDVIHDDGRSREISGRAAFAAWAEDRAACDEMPFPAEAISAYARAEDAGQQGQAQGELKKALVEAEILEAKPGKASFRRAMTRLFVGDEEEARTADLEYAMLLSLRYKYGEAERTLHLGTLMEDGDGEFWLCVQPVCDSVRLDGASPFPLLPMKSGKPDKKATIVCAVRGSTQRTLLWSTGTPDQIRLFKFEPDTDSRRVVFEAQDDGPHTVTTADGQQFRWIAELKTAHSNRVAHTLGEQLSRVGLDESEWLHEQPS